MPKAPVKVSIAIHTREPDLNGDQFFDAGGKHEAMYGGYNRQHVLMHFDEQGNGFIQAKNITFPNVNTDPETFSFFSAGVAVAPAGEGGSIIICGPIDPPFYAGVGHSPELVNIAIGVNKARLDEMRADGRFFDSMDPDPEHGLNLPD